MIDFPRSYKAVFFGAFQDITPSADTIPIFLEMFRDKGLLPSIFTEISLPSPKPQSRLRLSPPDGEWSVDIDLERIEIEKKVIKPRGTNLGKIEDFGRDAVSFFGRIFQRYPRKCSRLSIISEGLLNEMPEDKLQEIYIRLIRPPEFYAQNLPVEWNVRSVSRTPVVLEGQNDQLNVITSIGRVQGTFSSSDEIVRYDRISLAFDINTFHGNNQQRFDLAAVADFYPKAIALRATLLNQLENHLNAKGSI